MKKRYPTKLFFLFGLFFMSLTVTAQGPGSLFVDAGPDMTIQCTTGGCIDITATFLQTFDTSGITYSVNSIPYVPPFPFNGLATSLNPNIDDAWSAVDNLPFDFCFFGDLETQFQVGSNGVIRFDVDPGDTTNAWAFTEDLPNNSNPSLGEANVFTPVHDIDPSASNSEEIGYEVLGVFPNRVLVVAYFEVPLFSGACNALLATHMAVFYEFSNVVEIYIQDKPTCSSWNNGNAALGIQNDAGTTAFVPPGRNTSDSPWTTTNEAWSFAPQGPPTYVFGWYDSLGNFIADTPTINVCPTGTETYEARVTWTNTCNGETVTLSDFVDVVSVAPFTINLGPDITICSSIDIILDADPGIPGLSYEWFVNGVSQGPSTIGDNTYTVMSPSSANYYVEVFNPADPTCIVSDDITVLLFPQPVIENDPLDLIQCNDGVNTGVFDLEPNGALALGGQDPLQINIFYFNDAGIPILTPGAYPIVGDNETITIRLEDISGTCFAEATFEIYFITTIPGVIPDQTLCDLDGNGSEDIDLHILFDVIVLNGQVSGNFIITYHLTQVSADAGGSDLPTPMNFTTGTIPIFVRFESTIDSSCYETYSFQVTVEDSPVVNTMIDNLILCDTNNDGFMPFNLSQVTTDITGGAPDILVTFHGTLLDAQNNVFPLPDPYTNDEQYLDAPITDITDPLYGTGGVWARAESIITGCYTIVSFALEVRDSPIAVEPAEPLRVCDDDDDGFAFFDLTVVAAEVLDGLDPTEYNLYYYVLEVDAITDGDNALPTMPSTFPLAIVDPTMYLNDINPQIIYILLVGNTTSTSPPNPNGANGCYDIVPLTLIVDSLPLDLGPFEINLCDDEESGSTTDEVSIFDLTSMDSAITNNIPGHTVIWYVTIVDEMNNNPIPDPTMYPNINTPQTVVGRITSGFSCITLITMTLEVFPNPVPNFNPTPIELCDDDDDGIVNGFDPTIRDIEIIGSELNVSVLYYVLREDAEAGVPGTEIIAPYENIIPNSQIIFARVTNDVPPEVLPCYTIVELELIVIALPDMPTVDFMDPMIGCDYTNNGQALYNLTLQDEFVLGTQDPANFVVPITYYVLEVDAQAGLLPILNPEAYIGAPPETIWVRLESLLTGCFRISSFELELGALPTIGFGDDLYECDDEVDGSTSTDGLSTFDLTVNYDLITQGDPTLVVVYYASSVDQMNNDPITTPEAYQNIMSPQQEIFVDLINQVSCLSPVTSFFINVEPNPDAIIPTPLVACDVDNDGFYNFFILEDKDLEIMNGELDLTVAYYEFYKFALAETNQIFSPYANILPFSQTIFARVTRDVPPGVNPCFTIVSMELIVELMPDVPTDAFLDLIEECDDNNDGFAIFDLTVQDDAVLGTQTPATDYSITYHVDETEAINGFNAIQTPDTYTNIVSPLQTIWVRLESLLTGCARVSMFDIVVVPLPELAAGPFEMLECDDEENGSTPTDQISTFDLTMSDLIITNGNPNYSVVYYRTLIDQTNDIPIADPTAYQNLDDMGFVVNPQNIYVSVFSAGTIINCEVETILTLRVLPNPSPKTPTPLEICDGDGDPVLDIDNRDGISQFDLTSKDMEITNGEPDLTIYYYETFELAVVGDITTALISPYTNIEPNSQIVYARVTQDVPPAFLACYTIVPLELIVNPLPDDTAEISNFVVCEFGTDGVAIFDLTEKNPEILNGQNSMDFDIFFYQSQGDAQAGNNAIINPTAFTNTSNPQTIYVSIVDKITGCDIASTTDPITDVTTLSFELSVKEDAFAITPAEPYIICDNFGDIDDGIGEFTLTVDVANPTPLDGDATALATEILGSQDPASYSVTYYVTLENAETGTDPLPNVYVNIINPQIIYARVTTNIDPLDEEACYDTAQVILKVEQLPEVALEEFYRLCVDANGNPIPEVEGSVSPPVIDTGLDPAFYSFEWYIDGQLQLGQDDPFIVALQGGVYTVIVTELDNGCTVEVSTTVTESSPPLSYDVQVSSGAFAESHTITATVEGLGDYVFQLDDGPFQDEGLFEGVLPGLHTVTIKDANGCGSVTVEVSIIDYPRFVTPNHDGYHDTWNIIGIAGGDPTAKIYIFDRFGKLLKQISPLGDGWDGTYNGNPLPSSDYWFRVEYTEDETRKEFRGHFTLKR